MSAEPEVPEEAGMEEEGAQLVEMPLEPSEEEDETPEVSGETPAPAPVATTRRSQFRIVRESIQSLQIEVGRYRKSHEATSKRLEAQMASLRKDISTLARPKDLGAHFKGQESDTRRLEKQVATLRNELVSLKGQMAREAAKSRARQEAAFSRIASKVKAARPSKAKPSKKR